ncbi:hypothetical protein GC197_17400 [bacterium]|nr:hypothetical protein [bacterium]
MNIIVANRRSKPENLRKKFGEVAEIIDVTSKADQPWVRFSPFWPHGGIPVPLSDEIVGTSVEGIWQALKVFESEDVDLSKLEITNMKGLKRTVRRLGNVRGHRRGVNGDRLLRYREARELIYLPAYRWVLENCLQTELAQLRDLAEQKSVVLLDYQTNGDLEDLKTPLSHAALVKRYLEDDWPV